VKVLHVIFSVSSLRGGPSQAVLSLVKNLRSCGVDAEIATTNEAVTTLLDVPLNQKIEYEGVPVWFFEPFSPPNQGVSITSDKGFIFSATLTQWLWQNIRNYDILDNHYLFSYASTCAGAIARWQNVPYTVRTTGQLAPWALAQSRRKKQLYSFLIERHNLNRAAAIHCASSGEAEDARNFGVKAPIITLPLGVEQIQYQPGSKQQLRQNYQIPATTPIVLFLARIHPVKRPELLLKALAHLAQKYDFHLILAGMGETSYLDSLNNLASLLGLKSRISLPGFVTGEAKALLLQGADIFVLPSVIESFGISIAEAMAAGLPVIVTEDVKISSEILAAQAGLVVPGEVEALAHALAKLLSNPNLRHQMGENGKQLATRRYSWEAIACQLASVYTAIVQQQPLPQFPET
jgi:glycosyltransferase involved in cell wall biosynthesis